MNQMLSPTRQAFLALIMGSYGPVYVLYGPAGAWHLCWFHDAYDDLAMRSYLLEDDEQGTNSYSDQHTALKAALESIDSEISAGAVGYDEVRQRLLDDLVSILSEPAAVGPKNKFSGTTEESRLVDAWHRLDRQEVDRKREAKRKREEFDKILAEQVRREQAFDLIIQAFGEEAVDEINAAIEQAWATHVPKATRARPGLKVGDTLPMPRLVLKSGRASFHCPSRATAVPARTPLSKPDWQKGFVPHWHHVTWTAVVIPAMEVIVNRLADEAIKTLAIRQ